MRGFFDQLAKPRSLRVSGGVMLLCALVLSVYNQLIAPGALPGMVAYEIATYPGCALDMLNAWGEQGRHLFLQSIAWDFVFPAAYGFWLCGKLAQKFQFGWVSRLIPLAPLMAALFDWLENICQIITISGYPQPEPILVPLTAVFALLKFLLLLGSVIFLWFAPQNCSR